MKNKYAAPGKVAINGGSNGGGPTIPLIGGCIENFPSPGLLVAACVNRAPEGTYGAALAEVGVLDLLRVTISLFVFPVLY